jgi:amino acid adenylation domain-containing protein
LPLVELTPEHIERVVQAVPGGAANIQDIYPLAPLQEGILFHHLLTVDGGDTYAQPLVLSVSSAERLEDLIAALQAVVDRHDVLRTAVLWEQLPRPVQVVYRNVKLPVEQIAFDPERPSGAQVEEWLKQELQMMDLRRAPMIRLRVAPDPESEQWYAWVQMHHIAIDHVTLEIVISEAVAHLEQRAAELPEAGPYRIHVAQAHAYARKHDTEAFFRKKLGDIVEPTAPFGILDIHGNGTQIEEAREELEDALSNRVRGHARRLGVSAATLFHAAWGLVVASTSGRDDVVFGSVLLGRFQGSAGAQRILGMFINTLPMRLQLRGITTKQLLEHTQRELIELLTHEQASLAVAQSCSGITSAAPLFTTLLNYRHTKPNPDANWSNAKGIGVLAGRERTNYPIAISVDDSGDGFALTAQTDRRIDTQRITAYLRTAIESLVQALEQSPQTPALMLSILPQEERNRVVELFNPTAGAQPNNELIHELFERHARNTPDALALLYCDERLTYAELNRRANRLARYLRSHGVHADELVGLCVERSLEMVVGILGILKAGGAYVPLDPRYPIERLSYMLENAAPTMLLTQECLKNGLPECAARILALDSDWGAIEGYDSDNLEPVEIRCTPANLAYVIYTSGSTGLPKGVMLEHRGVCNLVAAQLKITDVSAHSRILQFASLSFDACTWEWVMALCTGASLCLATRDDLAPGEPLRATLSNQRITHALLPPVALGALSSQEGLDGLNTLLVGGEACSAALVGRWAPGRRFINAYGPTEITVCATEHPCDPRDVNAPPIGRPILNARTYILDDRQRPVPLGAVGEIYIGGVGVARGYLNRPDLTAERFLPDPFSGSAGRRMYRTGDIGRWRPDGVVEYLGRNDHQVKIRGFRIELGEIEAQLSAHANVKDVVVIAREDVPGDKRLVAYLVPDDAGAPSIEELRKQLSTVLPEYMVPAAFVSVETLPFTPNGKLDRRALPPPELSAYGNGEYQAPTGEIETALAQIWRDVIHIERVGREDNFFAIGGHSLHGIKLIEKVEQQLGVRLSVVAAFKYPTIKQMAEEVQSRKMHGQDNETNPLDGDDFEEGTLSGESGSQLDEYLGSTYARSAAWMRRST